VGVGLSRNRHVLAGLALVLLSACAYGITPALFKLAYRAQMDELSLIALRSAIGAGFVAVTARALGEARVERRAAVRLAGLGAVLFGPQLWLYFGSLHWVDTAVAVGVVYVYPAIIVLLTAVRRRRPPPMGEAILISLALVGIATIAVTAGPSRVAPTGVVLAAAAALGYAVYVVVVASLVADLPTLGASAWILAGTATATLAAAAVTGRLALPTSGLAWGYVLAHGLVVVPVGLVAFYAGLRRLGPVRTALVDTVQPVIAVVVGTAVLGEALIAGRALGIALVVAAVAGLPLLAVLPRRRKAPDEPIRKRGDE
jgi:drug/metabolite transporter (DMT)-like permease